MQKFEKASLFIEDTYALLESSSSEGTPIIFANNFNEDDKKLFSCSKDLETANLEMVKNQNIKVDGFCKSITFQEPNI